MFVCIYLCVCVCEEVKVVRQTGVEKSIAADSGRQVEAGAEKGTDRGVNNGFQNSATAAGSVTV